MTKVPVYRENAARGNYSLRFWPQEGIQAGIGFNQTYGMGNPSEAADPEVQKWIQNKDFRIAISLAMDRKTVNEVLFLGTGKEKQATFSAGHPFYPGADYESKYTKRDLAEANRMLNAIGLDKKDSSGFRLRTDGKGPLSIEVVYISQYFLDFKTLAEIVKENWEAVGIKVNLKAEDVNLFGQRRLNNLHQVVVDTCCDRHPLNFALGRSAFPAISAWYNAQQGGLPSVEPYNAELRRIKVLNDSANDTKYENRAANYIENQKIVIDQQYYVGLVGDTPAFNGVIVMKNNFKNVPLKAPNVSLLQNEGIGRTVQFFFEGGKNDAGQ